MPDDRRFLADMKRARVILNAAVFPGDARMLPHVFGPRLHQKRFKIPARFCRVHKQAIVRLSLVREIRAVPGGQYVAKLSDGYEVQVGRNYAHEFRTRFG